MTRRNFLAASTVAMSGTSLAAQMVTPFAAIDDRAFDANSLPDLSGAVDWLNSPALTGKSLRGKVVLVNFWTYSCINSLRPLPYIKSWAAKYESAGLVVVGVHTPEFPFEKLRTNVAWATRDLKIAYPVAMDSNYKIWQAFQNEYWPAFYFIDGKGRIRHRQFGEGDYAESERVLQDLLKQNGARELAEGLVHPTGAGVEAAPGNDVQSPETYVGYRGAERFSSPERVARDARQTYTLPPKPRLNQWGLNGAWEVNAQSGVLHTAPGKIVFRFHSRDLHLVMGGADHGAPVRFKVTLDGAAPGNHCGVDSAADGAGEIREPRLYQLIRQKGQIADRLFEIEFLDAGAQAFSFTFG